VPLVSAAILTPKTFNSSLTIAPSTYNGSSSMLLTWTPAAGALGYVILNTTTNQFLSVGDQRVNSWNSRFSNGKYFIYDTSATSTNVKYCYQVIPLAIAPMLGSLSPLIKPVSGTFLSPGPSPVPLNQAPASGAAFNLMPSTSCATQIPSPPTISMTYSPTSALTPPFTGPAPQVTAISATVNPTPHPGNQILYLSTTPPFGDGSSPSAPLDASTTQKYDNIMQTYTSPTTFYYAPGVYLTNGWQTLNCVCSPLSDIPTAISQVQHFGSGIDQTIIRFAPKAPANVTGRAVAFATFYNSASDGFEMWNMTLDGNAINGVGGTSPNFGNVGLVNASGSNLEINSVKIMGWGSGVLGVESFPINIGSLTSFTDPLQRSNYSHVHIENSIFTLPASSGNVDGVTISTVGCMPISNCSDFAILNNQYVNINPAGSNFSYSHAFYAPWIQGNSITGPPGSCAVGFYQEPGSWSGLPAGPQIFSSTMIIGNQFTNCAQAIAIYTHPNGSMGLVTITNNTFTETQPSSYAPSLVWIYTSDPGPLTVTNPQFAGFVIQANSISFDYTPAMLNYSGGVNYSLFSAGAACPGSQCSNTGWIGFVNVSQNTIYSDPTLTSGPLAGLSQLLTNGILGSESSSNNIIISQTAH
jgi:hypothetical protein